MAFLLLRLGGPMQAWGTRSRFEYRDTEREPTFSGIIGMAAAAEGLARDADLGEYHELRMTVRVDREGELSREFQTAENVITADKKTKSTQIVHRDFLADAAFHAALEGPDALLKRIFGAFERPRYPLFLGRKSYVPSIPIIYPGDESYFSDDRDALSFLGELPVAADFPLHLGDLAPGEETETVRFVVHDADSKGDSRRDIPRQFDIHRRSYATRYVKTCYRDVPRARDTGGNYDA